MLTDKCKYCDAQLPAPHEGRGKQKQFCNDNCRVKYGYRKKNGVTTNRQKREAAGLKVLPTLSDLEKVWLAAMVDAEGWLGLVWRERERKGSTTKHVYPFVCALANTNPKLIERAVQLIGEENVYVRTKKFKQHFKQIQDVFVSRQVMVAFLEAIMPHLIGKTRQAEILVEFCLAHDDLPVRTQPLDSFKVLADECRALNKRGRVVDA